MITPDTYIVQGDEIQVVFRTTERDGLKGTVLEICSGGLGARELLIVPSGTQLAHTGAVGVREDEAIFSVRRGDSWVIVPPLTSLAAAAKKIGRHTINTAARIARKVPLFADQIQAESIELQAYVDGVRRDACSELERAHAQAQRATECRAQVQQLVSADEFSRLLLKRERWPQDSLYGLSFWSKHLEFIQQHGRADLFAPAVSMTKKLSLPWLRWNNILTWRTAPGHPVKVRVLFIGSTAVCVRLAGEMFKDYDPSLVPDVAHWLHPDEFAEATVPFWNVYKLDSD